LYVSNIPRPFSETERFSKEEIARRPIMVTQTWWPIFTSGKVVPEVKQGKWDLKNWEGGKVESSG
jgi:hypothetical protein